MASAARTMEEIGADWVKLLERALQFDGWGQVVEAVEAYERLGSTIAANIDSVAPTKEIRSVFNKVILCVNLRARSITSAKRMVAPEKDEVANIVPFLRSLFAGEAVSFPVDMTPYSSETLAVEKVIEKDIKMIDSSADRGGTLKPMPELKPGRTYLSFDIEKWGLKDAETYVDPRITISVHDSDGKEVEGEQDTPTAVLKRGMYVFFDTKVHLQTNLEAIKKENMAVFFEFKHWKPKKKKLSTRCFCFMEPDEIKEGVIKLELYKKPTDFKRKKLKLHTIKPLFLHMTCKMHTV